MLPTQTSRSILQGQSVSVSLPSELFDGRGVRGPVVEPVGVVIGIAVETKAAAVEEICAYVTRLIVRDRACSRDGDDRSRNVSADSSGIPRGGLRKGTGQSGEKECSEGEGLHRDEAQGS